MNGIMKVKEERKMLGYVIDYFETLADKLRKSGFFDRVEIAGSAQIFC